MAVLRACLGGALGILAIAALVHAAPAPEGPQEAASEYDVKAAFLYNFTKFVEWPAAAFHDDRGAMRLCVLGDDPFGSSLGEIAEGDVAGRRLTVWRFRAMKDPATCQILFVSRSETGRLPQILRSVRDAPVLTVGDTQGFLEQGGIVNFIREGSKVRFEISQESAERAGIKISSRLLRLAVRVLSGAPPGA